MLVENSIGARRLWPAAAAIVVAMFSRDAGTAGPDRAGAAAGRRPSRSPRIVAERRAADGLLAPSWPPLAAAASLIFVIVFRDQTLATVAESARIKYVVGPTIAWYQDFLRYYFLTVEDSVDGSLTRRFSVLVLLLCMFGLLRCCCVAAGCPARSTDRCGG